MKTPRLLQLALRIGKCRGAPWNANLLFLLRLVPVLLQEPDFAIG